MGAGYSFRSSVGNGMGRSSSHSGDDRTQSRTHSLAPSVLHSSSLSLHRFNKPSPAQSLCQEQSMPHLSTEVAAEMQRPGFTLQTPPSDSNKQVPGDL